VSGVLIIRRVIGDSMLPGIAPGMIVIGWGRLKGLRRGDVVILSHNAMEKIKRIDQIDGDELYVLGDNLAASTDSRQFGWIDRKQVLARVIWPRPI
jgi:nickel-type superoxide dismutase maturation protease